MIPSWVSLGDHDRNIFRSTIAFLNKRLNEQSTVNWALHLTSRQYVERTAIVDLLHNPRETIIEPFATAWRLIEESWSSSPIDEGPSTAIYHLQGRLRAGDRSGALVSELVSLVAPRLEVKAIERHPWSTERKRRKPKEFSDLVSSTIGSGDLIERKLLDLPAMDDLSFLVRLANELDAAVNRGLEIARRLGWNDEDRFWLLGDLSRVYYTTLIPPVDEDRDRDPDTFHRGIAPSVKLLFEVVNRISNISIETAIPFVSRWSLAGTPIHKRLWAAAARDTRLATANELAQFFRELNDRQFWNVHSFPEIAELRALRFGDLGQEDQSKLIKRILKGPPRNFWPKKTEAAAVAGYKKFWSLRELRRIQIAENNLGQHVLASIEELLREFPELADVTIHEGFPEGPVVRSRQSNPDNQLDTLQGLDLLQALETALATRRGNWDDDPAGRANDWLQNHGNTNRVVNELEAAIDQIDRFPNLWNRLGWVHTPRPMQAQPEARNLDDEARRLFRLIARLSEVTLSAAIEGISNWLEAWGRHIIDSEDMLATWLRVWPIAIEKTNAQAEDGDQIDLSVTARSIDDKSEPMDLDTLNTPAGKLVGLFLTACPTLRGGINPFSHNSVPGTIRETVISAPGRSGLIVRHRLIESLFYFLKADREWTEQNLFAPLLADNARSLALWRAIARRTQWTEVLSIIGGAMAAKATDHRLGRDTRRSLVFSLVVETLHAFRQGRDPAVPNDRIQQMLRQLDDEVRAAAANTVQQFVRDLSTPGNGNEPLPSPEELFRIAVVPFLRDVWPQERSLATPGVSKAFADLPATAREAFTDAVNSVERFLVPCECWSLLEYGFSDAEPTNRANLSSIDTPEKAEAFLRLLDRTIGTAEGAVVPYDLADALEQIRSAAHHLAGNTTFRRLETLTRR